MEPPLDPPVGESENEAKSQALDRLSARDLSIASHVKLYYNA